MVMLTSSCHDDIMRGFFPDAERNGQEGVKEDVEVDAVISLNASEMMGVQPGKLRALTGSQEKNAEAVRILVFEVPVGNTDESQETLSYEARVISAPKLDETTGRYQLKVRLHTKKNHQRLVILANYPKELGSFDAGTTKADVYKKMQSNFLKWKVDGDKGNAQAGRDFDFLPMWGESDTQLVTENSMAITFGDWQSGMPLKNTIYLHRSLARVDVGVAFQDKMTEDNTSGETPKTDAELVKDFRLTKVYVYRYNTQYQIPGSISSFKGDADQVKMISEPCIPATSKLAGVDAPLVYEVPNNEGKLVRSIYIPESRKPTSNKTGAERDAEMRDAATCVVVGGVYTGKVGNLVHTDNTEESFYRIDFFKGGHQTSPTQNTEKIYMDILRNHRYRINITKVGGPGYKTPEEALKHNDYSIFYTVSVWNNADLSRVITDGQYMLGIDKDNFVFGVNGDTEIPNAITDWPEGWTAEILPDDSGTIPSWLHVGTPSSTGDIKWSNSIAWTKRDPEKNNDFYGPLPIKADFYTNPKDVNGEKQPRFAKIKLKAGRMEWVLNVKQLPHYKPILRLLAAESIVDTEEQIGGNRLTANRLWNNWKLPTEVGSLSDHIKFDLFSMADASSSPRKIPRYGVHATIDFNGNIPKEVKENYDRRIVVLQWGPKEAEALVGSKVNRRSEGATPVSGQNKPALYINALTSVDFEIKAFAASQYLQIAGATVYPLDQLKNEPVAHRYFQQDQFSEQINKNWTDAAYTVVLLITAPGLEGNGELFESRYNELEFVLDVDGEGISKSLAGVPANKNESLLKCNLSLTQQESSAVPFVDKEGVTSLVKWVEPDNSHIIKENNRNIWRYVDAKAGLYIMNGEAKNFYVRSNTPYRIELVKQELDSNLGGSIPSDGSVSGDNNVGLFISDFYGTPSTGNVPPKYGEFKSSGKIFGEPIQFTTVNDTETNIRKGGTATFRIVSNHPIRKQFRDREFTVRFVSAVKQPEANCYMMLRGGQGILIPVSRVNTAREFYYKIILQQPERLKSKKGSGIAERAVSEFQRRTVFHGLDKKQYWYPEIEWANDNDGYKKPINPNGKALFRAIMATGLGCDSYIYVEPGDTYTGNAMLTIKDEYGQILWSWHIWVLEEYPKAISVPVEVSKNGTGNIGTNNTKQYWMDRNLGAIDVHKENGGPNQFKSYGYLYQQGRKDPFPTVTEEEFAFYSNKDGGKYEFSSLGRKNPVSTDYLSAVQQVYRSIPELIQTPANPVYNEKEFLYERGLAGSVYSTPGSNISNGLSNVSVDGLRSIRAWYFLWGGTIKRSLAAFGNTRDDYDAWITYKTPFDPCPYGWKVASAGPESRWFAIGVGGDARNTALEGFYVPEYNGSGAAGSKTKYVQKTGSDGEAKTCFPIPGVIFDGAYDGTFGSSKGCISVLKRYRSDEIIAKRKADDFDDWREPKGILISQAGAGVGVKPGYMTSDIDTSIASPLVLRAKFMGKQNRTASSWNVEGGNKYYLNGVDENNFEVKIATAYPLRPVANVVPTGSKTAVLEYGPYQSSNAEGIKDVVSDWVFKDESDWTKYLPKRKSATR